MKIIKITVPVFKAQIRFFIGQYDDLPAKWKAIERFENNTYMARTIYQKTNHQKYPFQVAIHSRSAAYSVLAHESIHAVNMILDSMGVLPSFENDEVQSYAVQYLLEQCEKALKNYK